MRTIGKKTSVEFGAEIGAHDSGAVAPRFYEVNLSAKPTAAPMLASIDEGDRPSTELGGQARGRV